MDIHRVDVVAGVQKPSTGLNGSCLGREVQRLPTLPICGVRVGTYAEKRIHCVVSTLK